MTTQTEVLDYKERMTRDRRWAMDEGDRYFSRDNEVFKTLRKIARRLDDLDVPYAVVGGLALFAHGYERFTSDVDILVSPDGLKTIHDRLEGLGYLPPFKGSKNLRDTEHGVRIEFLVAGQHPGSGMSMPIAFPDPDDVAVELDGIRYLNLPTLVELKLASGMTGGIHRMKDLVDVIELIKITSPPASFADELNPYVRDKYLELWTAVAEAPPGPDAD